MQAHNAHIETSHEHRNILLIRRFHAAPLIPRGQERAASHGADDSLVFFIHFRDISFSAHGQPIWIHGFGRALDPCFKYILAVLPRSVEVLII